MIQTQNIRFQYPDNEAIMYPDLYCPSGDRMLVSGASGKGKTTLLHLLAGVLSPENGSIRILNQDIHELSSSQRDAFRAQNIGLVFQKNLFIQGLSVWENLTAAQKLAGKSNDRHYIRHLCDSLDVTHLIKKKPYQLSQGEQQRFSLARALVNTPKVLLADEPTSHLDDDNCLKFMHLWNKIKELGTLTQVVVSHDNRIASSFQLVYKL